MKVFLTCIAFLLAIVPAMAQNSGEIEKFVGAYQLEPDTIVTFTRAGDRLVVQGAGQPAIELSPDGPDQFVSRHGQWRFETDTTGTVIGAVLTQYGNQSKATRLGARQAAAIRAAQEARVRDNTPSPGTENALRQQIIAIANGMPDYSAMTPGLASVIQKDAAMAVQIIQKQGALKSLTFKKRLRSGANVYEAKFDNGNMEWVIAPLTSGGKIDHMMFKEP